MSTAEITIVLTQDLIKDFNNGRDVVIVFKQEDGVERLRLDVKPNLASAISTTITSSL